MFLSKLKKEYKLDAGSQSATSTVRQSSSSVKKLITKGSKSIDCFGNNIPFYPFILHGVTLTPDVFGHDLPTWPLWRWESISVDHDFGVNTTGVLQLVTEITPEDIPWLEAS